jgi:hypothetical protein
VRVSNVTREVQSHVEADPEGLRGRTVERRIVDLSNLTWDILTTYVIDSVDCGDEEAEFVLEKPVPAFELSFPMLAISRDDFPTAADA